MLSPLKPDDIGGVSNFAWVILCPLPTLSLLSIAHCCLLALSPFLPPVDMESSSRISALIWVSGARRMKMWVIIYNKFYLTLLLCLEYWLHLHSVVSYLENRHKVFFFTVDMLSWGKFSSYLLPNFYIVCSGSSSYIPVGASVPVACL